MRLFVTEFITGGGIANDPLPGALKQEGHLMLQAVLSDCSQIDDIDLVTTCDSRIKLSTENVEVHIVENAIDYMQQVKLIAAQCDTTWVIAPESDGILVAIIEMLKTENITLINCDAESIYNTSDKLQCEQILHQYEILTTKSLSYEEVISYNKPAIIKARYGVGCEGLMLCKNGEDALAHIDDFSQWVVQPYLEGTHLSVSLIFTNNTVSVLSMNEQVIDGDNELKLSACYVNVQPVNEKIKHLAKKIQQALPGLRGYVGVDMIESMGKYYIVDINPRLTTSYVGLCEVLDHNPAELCINSILHSTALPEVKTKDKYVEVNVV